MKVTFSHGYTAFSLPEWRAFKLRLARSIGIANLDSMEDYRVGGMSWQDLEYDHVFLLLPKRPVVIPLSLCIPLARRLYEIWAGWVKEGPTGGTDYLTDMLELLIYDIKTAGEQGEDFKVVMP